MTLEISIADRAAILAHAASTRDEVCGLLLGEGMRVARAVPTTSPRTRRWFELDPAALLAAHRAGRGGGLAVIGHYHSHPSGDPTPSLRDAADAAPDGDDLAAGRGRRHDGVARGARRAAARPASTRAAGGLRGEFRAVIRRAEAFSPRECHYDQPGSISPACCVRGCATTVRPSGRSTTGWKDPLADDASGAPPQRCMDILLAQSARTSANKLKSSASPSGPPAASVSASTRARRRRRSTDCWARTSG
ncbi:Mov34/MPN/PAD-1 family protein [Sphingomonas sp. MMS24-JH45]